MAAFYTLLYIATPGDAAALVSDEDAYDKWPSIWLKHIGDQELVALWRLATGKPHEPGLTLMADLLYQGSAEGPFVMRIPREFVSAMAGLSTDQRDKVLAAWGRAEEMVHWKPAELAETLNELCAFARRAVKSGKSILQVATLD